MRLERMRMYGAAEQLCIEIEGLLKIIGRRAPRQADHLERSSDSVLFNVAEGAGAFRPGLKINAYEIARKEANEVRGILRRCVIKGVVTESQIRPAFELAGACVGMLTRAIIAIEERRNMK